MIVWLITYGIPTLVTDPVFWGFVAVLLLAGLFSEPGRHL